MNKDKNIIELYDGHIIHFQLHTRLKDLRIFHHLSQQQLADKLGMSQQIIGHYESGRAMPTLVSLIKIAEYFDVSMDFLVGRTNCIW